MYGGIESRRSETRFTDPGAGGERQAADAEILHAARIGEVAYIRLGAFLPAAADAFVGAELEGIERSDDVGAIPQPASQFSMHACTDIEPGARHDHRVDERAFHAIENGRFVAFVDD